MRGLSALVAKEVGVATGTMWVLDSGRITEISLTPDVLQTLASYVAYYSKLDPWQQGAVKNIGQVYIGNEEISDAELHKTEFYNDFARHTGVVRPMGAVLPLTPLAALSVGVQQPGTGHLFEQRDKPRLGRLLPYIKRAMQLRLRVRGQAARAAAHAAAIEALAFGLVVCDAGGRILFSNDAAELLAKQQTGILLGRSDQGIGAMVPREARALSALVHDAASGGPGNVMRLTAQDGATGLLVLVTPLPRGVHPNLGDGHALIALRPVADNPVFTETMLATLFGLSPTQASIAHAIYNGQTPEEIAAARGIKISTLRTHLTEIFLRTGAENQRDLVRLLGTLPPLLRGIRRKFVA